MFLKLLIFTIYTTVFCTLAAAQDIDCKVVGVTDGDTLTCLTDEKRQVKVRLAQIDAPESSQPFGQRAKQALSDHVFGKRVLLKTETTDRYGRVVAKIISEGRDVNLQMIESGMAWVYKEYARDKAYFAAHAAAERSQIGLWSDPSPINPSEWRRGSTRQVATGNAGKSVEENSSKKFSCSGKRYCKEMLNCAEARFYLTQCGATQLDRDRDGVPCESVCQ
jgi:endonuclease YncB( thermonuclease family)